MNRVNKDKLKDPLCDGGIMLEPRLQEYLKKRAFFKKNKIESSVPLEDEFMITEKDLNVIKAFMNGKKNIYNVPEDTFENKIASYNENYNQVEYDDSKKFNFFASREFKNDPHFKLLQKKMEKDKEAMSQRNNYQNYQFMKPINSDDISNTKYEHSTLLTRNYKHDDMPLFQDRDFDEQSKYKQNPNLFKPQDVKKYHNAPKTQYKQIVPTMRDNYMKEENCIPHDSDARNIIGELDTYKNNISMNHQQYQYTNEMDYESKKVIPTMNSKEKKYINTSNYQNIPIMKKEGLRDICLENTIRKLPSKDTKRKSYGYSNPAEHYFDYITDDSQKPEHVVLPFPRGGSATRQTNKTTARPYKRDIY
jgi:hypothetical protein